PLAHLRRPPRSPRAPDPLPAAATEPAARARARRRAGGARRREPPRADRRARLPREPPPRDPRRVGRDRRGARRLGEPPQRDPLGGGAGNRRLPRAPGLRMSGGARVNVGVAGLGYWGNNLVRTFAAQPFARLSDLCDLDPARVEKFAAANPGARMH